MPAAGAASAHACWPRRAQQIWCHLQQKQPAAVAAGAPIAAALAAAAADAAYFPPPDAAGGWREGLAGISHAKLEVAFEASARSTPHGGLLVVRRGRLAFERYFGRAHRDANPDMASTGKAFCAVVSGINPIVTLEEQLLIS
jgi:hypothetical protein